MISGDNVNKIKSNMKLIWMLFGLYIFILIFEILISGSPANASSFVWIFLSAYSMVFSLFLLAKNKLPNRRQIGIAFLLAILVYIGYCGRGSFISFWQIVAPIVTFTATCAFFSVANKYKETSLKIIRENKLKSIILSIGVGLLVGIILGIINYLIMKGSCKTNYSLSIPRIMVALSPGICEEIACRAVLYSFCLYLLGGKIVNKSESFICWVMMIVPHGLAHTPSCFMENGLISGLLTTLVFCIVFGLPLAILQRKRDIMSAMIAHGMVDAIRFVVFGI